MKKKLFFVLVLLNSLTLSFCAQNKIDYFELNAKEDNAVPLYREKIINNPDASVGICCSHKVVAVGFNTLCYDASVGVLNPPHE